MSIIRCLVINCTHILKSTFITFVDFTPFADQDQNAQKLQSDLLSTIISAKVRYSNANRLEIGILVSIISLMNILHLYKTL